MEINVIKYEIGFLSTVISLCSLVVARLDSPQNVQNRAITELLNSLLDDYNRYLRPCFGGPPLEVQTNILIRSVGPVLEEQMMFSMDCYFRQQWRDTRLAFNTTNHIHVLRPSIKMLDLIWKPDTYFVNGQDSYVHKITYVNKFLRIYNDSRIYFSQRLTIKSTCPMLLHRYPLDTQICPLYLSSYGYDEKDLQLVWTDNAVKKYKDITMAQFLLIEPIFYGVSTLGPSHGNRSALFVEFRLKREIGYFLLQIYLPCYLIVIISWISFWINREATPARVTLGITTLLTTCTIAITGREGIPKVSYSTALDVFLLMCFSFVFAALVEYAGVNYFTKGTQREGPMIERDSDQDDHHSFWHRKLPYTGLAANGLTDHHLTAPKSDSCCTMFLHCLRGNAKYRSLKLRGTRDHYLSVSRIDSFAKVLFPSFFVCLNILYWVLFLHYLND